MDTCKKPLMNGFLLLWISLIFRIKLCSVIHEAILFTHVLYCNDLYTIRSGIQLPFICYIAVADRFTRTDITYIQVTLPYLKLRDAVKNIFRVPLYKLSK